MSGLRSKRKGKAGELEVARLLRPLYPEVGRNGHEQSAEGGVDLRGVPWRVEVKRQKRPNLRAALRQAEESTGRGAPVAFTRADRDEWVVTMRAEDWVELVRRAESAEEGP